MSTKQRPVRRSVRRARDALVVHEPKSDVAALALLRKDLNEAIGLLTNGAAAQKAIAKQSRVQAIEINRLRRALHAGFCLVSCASSVFSRAASSIVYRRAEGSLLRMTGKLRSLG